LTEGLAWPPTKEDLERLYLVERLSAAKIARVYGLNYKNAKVAESTVLYHLKKNGIARRDKVELVRKVTDSMVDDWVERYQAGESLKRIAAGNVVPVTVWNHLRARGIVLRNKAEAQILAVTKYEKKSFLGDAIERAYLVGFTKGDCQVTIHGRAIRVRTSTTHPAMADLFANLFGCYGHVQRYPRESKLVGYEWSLEVDLDQSFRFLLRGLEETLEEFGRSPATFLAFLSGFFDAEGSIFFHKKGNGGAFETAITNLDTQLLIRIQHFLTFIELHSKLDTNNQDVHRLGYEKGGTISKIRIWRSADVVSFLRSLRLRHREKATKAEIAISYQTAGDVGDRARLRRQWVDSLREIAKQRNQFIEDARLGI
jgi:LAGLIDADG DNA endonuclease family protein